MSSVVARVVKSVTSRNVKLSSRESSKAEEESAFIALLRISDLFQFKVACNRFEEGRKAGLSNRELLAAIRKTGE